jgi:enoyl-CoA hydratase/carnithine racemase
MTGTDDGPRVRYEKKGHVAHVTLDRPAVLNAMDLRMHAELAAVWDDVEADDRVRVAVLTGAGERYTWEERRRRSRDASEGVLAFLERRDPHWLGHLPALSAPFRDRGEMVVSARLRLAETLADLG